MKKFIFSLIFFAVGCSDPIDQASTNLKKGDEFFAKNEYEAAEYYYDRIPEESPFYPQAQKKMNAIAVFKAKWRVNDKDSSEISKVVLVENISKMNNISRVPTHMITIANNSTKLLESIEVEFTYYDQNESVITALITEVKTPLKPKSQETYYDITPGLLQERFTTCQAKIINAHFH